MYLILLLCEVLKRFVLYNWHFIRLRMKFILQRHYIDTSYCVWSWCEQMSTVTKTRKTKTQDCESLHPINRFETVICVCLSQARTWISKDISGGLVYVQWLEVRGDCFCCWDCWKCWPSLLQLYIHNQWHIANGWCVYTENGRFIVNC